MTNLSSAAECGRLEAQLELFEGIGRVKEERWCRNQAPQSSSLTTTPIFVTRLVFC